MPLKTPNEPVSRTSHPAVHQRRASLTARRHKVAIPADVDNAEIQIEDRIVRLTNLGKLFWPQQGITKGDLLRYYAAMAHVLLPHLQNRAMVMKRYPDGAEGDFFFMKRAPTPRPEWLEVCSIAHRSGNVIESPVIQDIAALLWVVNLGCIDLNPWYARCDDVDRPDYLHFDLDPVLGAGFSRVRETALILRETLGAIGMKPVAKTTGSRGLHVYIPIVRGPTQKEVWTVAKRIAQLLASRHPKLITAEYRVAKRPRGRVLVDYNQNAWGRTLASAYSARPRPLATVSAPVTWIEIQEGIRIEDFRIANMRERVAENGDLWKVTLAARGRFELKKVLNEI